MLFVPIFLFSIILLFRNYCTTSRDVLFMKICCFIFIIIYSNIFIHLLIIFIVISEKKYKLCVSIIETNLLKRQQVGHVTNILVI